MEGSQAHDVRYRLGIPTFGEHPDGNNLLNVLAGLSGSAHCVHGEPELFRKVLF